MDNSARRVIADHLGVSASQIVDDATFRSLGADSLDLISLTMVLEETFDLHIPAEQAESCTTVGDAMSLLSRRLETRPKALVGEAR
jgi:acyl carrier protein